MTSGVHPRPEALRIRRGDVSVEVPDRNVLFCIEATRIGHYRLLGSSAVHLALADRRVMPVIDPVGFGWATEIPARGSQVVVARGTRRLFALLADEVDGVFGASIGLRVDSARMDRVLSEARRSESLVFVLDPARADEAFRRRS